MVQMTLLEVGLISGRRGSLVRALRLLLWLRLWLGAVIVRGLCLIVRGWVCIARMRLGSSGVVDSRSRVHILIASVG